MLPAWLEKQKQVGLCIWLDVTYYLPLASDDVIYTLILFPKFHTFYSHHFPPSDNGVYTLVLTSFLFQISLYLIKKYRYVIKRMSRYYHYNQIKSLYLTGMPWNPTTRIPNSSSSSQKASHGNISGIIFKKIWTFQISLQLFLNFSVIFLDFSNALSNDCTTAWVTWPERPKGMKDVIEQARRAQSHKSGPGGPLDFWYINIASNISNWPCEG